MNEFVMQFLICMGLGSAGAASLEIMKAYEIKHKLPGKTYQKLIKSKMFWLTVVGMVLSSGFLAWILNVDSSGPLNYKAVFFSGAFARTFFRQGVTNALNSKTESTKPPLTNTGSDPLLGSNGSDLHTQESIKFKDVFL